ncbi:MAG: hypothetical protein Q9227_002786 [Pyrenula ochraceoflavens]
MPATSEQQAALDLNNQARARHGVPALVWDDTLAAHAQAYAEQMAASGVFAHSDDNSRPNEGENIAYFSNSDPAAVATWNQGVQIWLDEEKNYHGEVIPQGDFESYGHYTQCLWKNTTNCGLGRATDGKGGTYFVGRYTPQGNIYGQTPY